ncbi:MAG: hypothetical protein QOD84_1986 [Acidobacteriaceae bacterium]|jgi:hypothetical protein
MRKSTLMRGVSTAALVLTAALIFSSLAVAQYGDDDDRYSQRGNGQQAHQYGYQSGYRDGYRKGQHEGRENDPGDVSVADLQEATHGYQRWMGPVRYFQDGYRDGYRVGFRSGYQAVNNGWGNRNGDDDRGGYYSDGRYEQESQYGQGYGSSAYEIGYRDGASVAREDVQSGKPYNDRPRGRYDDMDHGYRSEYGSKNAYKAQYANGYRAGYQSSAGRY